MTKLPLICFSLLCSASAFAAEATLSVEAGQMVANDELVLSVTSEAEAKNAGELNASLDTALNTALRIAKQYPAVQTSLVGRSAYPVYTDKQKINGWRGQNRLELKSKDFDQIGKLSSALSSTFSITSVDYRVSEALETKVQNQLISEASESFKTRAGLIATSLGDKSFSIETINFNFNSQGFRPMPMYAAKGMAVMNESADMSSGSGETRIIVSVNGSIETK